MTRSYRRKKRASYSVKVNESVAREIWAIIYLVVGILIALSIKGAFGILGDMFNSATLPILGWGVYIVPGIFAVISVLLFFSKKVHFGATKTLGVILFLISVLSIFHLSVPIDKIYEFGMAGSYGGGVGFVSNFLLLEVLGIGRIGASIIFVAMFLVSLMLIFEVTLHEIFRFLVPEIHLEVKKDPKKAASKAEKIGRASCRERV